PANPAPYRSAGNLYRTLGDPVSAVDVLEDGRKRAEGDADALAAELAAAHNEAGDVQSQAGRVERAEEHWERAVDLAEPGTRTLAIALRSLGSSAAYGRDEPDYERATDFLLRAVAADPDDPTTHHLLGLVHLDSGRMEPALDELRTAAELDPTELTYGDLGRAYRLNREFGESVAALERAVEIAPEFAWGFAELGETYRLMDENEEAARALERAIELEPDYAWAWGTLGQVRSAQGDLDAALASLETAASLDDSQSWILMELGEVHRRRGELDEAIPPLRRVLERNPENAWTLGTLGQVYHAQDRTDEAIETLERAASLEGGELPWVYAELGRAHLGRGAVDPAIDSFRKAIELLPGHEDYYDWLWIAYMREGRHADLAEEFERLADEHPGVPRIRSLLGHLYHDFLLEYDRALEHLEEAVSLGPESPDQAANLAEAYLTNERFAIAYDLASRIIDEHHGGGEHGQELSPSADLSMRFVVIASLILQERTAEARLELGEFLRHFRAHLEEGFDQTWDYSGTKAFVAGREIDPESRELLLLVVDVLESGEAGALEKLESFLGITKKG
ncbi:MAG TPA: tetratricopeptide repeat protein, partial [Longimicrobiales bacterium]|nr:tetratricopeptide repeat protein [Longimicrobiales bacterium]